MINVQFHHAACIKAQSEYFSSYLVPRPQDLTQAVPKHGEEVSFELGTILYAENSVAYHTTHSGGRHSYEYHTAKNLKT
jgi:hypothetical protein